MARLWECYLIVETEWNLTFTVLDIKQKQLVCQQLMQLLEGQALAPAPGTLEAEWTALFDHAFEIATIFLEQHNLYSQDSLRYIQHLFYFKLLFTHWSEHKARPQTNHFLPPELTTEWLSRQKHKLDTWFKLLEYNQSLEKKLDAILNPELVQKILSYITHDNSLIRSSCIYVFFALNTLFGSYWIERYMSKHAKQSAYSPYIVGTLLSTFFVSLCAVIAIDDADRLAVWRKKIADGRDNPIAAILGKSFEKLSQTKSPPTPSLLVIAGKQIENQVTFCTKPDYR